MNAMKRFFVCFIAFCLSWVTRLIPPEMALAQTLTVATPELGQPLLALNSTPTLNRFTAADFDPTQTSSLTIDFDEFSNNTYSPVYSPDAYDANDTAPKITFRAFFKGQDYSYDPDQDCNGATDLGCVAGTPSNPLTLADAAYVRPVRISADSQASQERVLTTQSSGAYGILFDKDVAAFGVSVLNLDAVGSVSLRVFDRQGTLLKEVTNQQTGREFFGLGTSDSADKIAGVQFSLVNPEAGGYEIGDLRFIQSAYQPDIKERITTDPNKVLEGVYPVNLNAFQKPTGRINFNEDSSDLWTAKYEPSAYGAGASAPTVTFRALFEGQSYSDDQNHDCGGSTSLGCIVGNPSAPLALPSSNAYVRSARSKLEREASEGHVLATQNNAAYSAYFDKDVASIGVNIFGFDEVGRTLIKVYDRQGKLLGQVSNQRRGDEFFGFATDDGENRIAGLQVSMIEREFDGYVLDSLTFTQKQEVVPPVENKPPQRIKPMPDQTFRVGDAYAIDLNRFFTDPDHGPMMLTYSLEGDLPPGLTLMGNLITGGVDDVPNRRQYVYPITVTASDGEDTVQDKFTIRIKFDPVTINIDASQNNEDNPVLQFLPTGTYTVHVLSTAEGGLFDAWNSHNVERGCDGDGRNCDFGWETRYYFKSPYHKVTDSRCRKKKFGSCHYEIAAQAAANAPDDEVFTLSKNKEMKFYMWDSRGLEDNQGGLSLRITQQ